VEHGEKVAPYGTTPPGWGLGVSADDAARHPPQQVQGVFSMLMTIVVILIILWILGLVTSYTMGGLVHILLVIAIIVILVRVIQGRKPL
jgi:hypothetical protein